MAYWFWTLAGARLRPPRRRHCPRHGLRVGRCADGRAARPPRPTGPGTVQTRRGASTALAEYEHGFDATDQSARVDRGQSRVAVPAGLQQADVFGLRVHLADPRR